MDLRSKTLLHFLDAIEKHINEYSIPHHCDVYSAVSDADLDGKVSSIVSFFPDVNKSQWMVDLCVKAFWLVIRG